MQHVKQVISALEKYRFDHQHEPPYVAHPEGGISLRDDARIKMFETAAQAKGPERIAQAQVLKAAGSSAGATNLLYQCSCHSYSL